MSNSDNYNFDIAVIGMAGRFPMAENLVQFWQNLRDGVESISFFSDEEIESSGISRELLGDPQYVRAAAFLKDPDLFDAEFFGFNPREASIMDPQQRIFLEQAWKALESAGYNSETYKGRIGLYAGAALSTYLINNILSNRQILESAGIFQTEIGNSADYLATQV